MNKKIIFLKFIFHFLTFFLIILSLFPGSLLGFMFYGDFGRQPNIINNPFGTTINHFIYYLILYLIGFIVYLRDINLKKLVLLLFFLSIILEILHLIIPNRSFQLGDLIGNILGVTVAYLIIKIYLYFNRT